MHRFISWDKEKLEVVSSSALQCHTEEKQNLFSQIQVTDRIVRSTKRKSVFELLDLLFPSARSFPTGGCCSFLIVGGNEASQRIDDGGNARLCLTERQWPNSRRHDSRTSRNSNSFQCTPKSFLFFRAVTSCNGLKKQHARAISSLLNQINRPACT